MTLEESIKLLALIKLAYPNSYKDIDKDTQLATINLWHRTFGSVPFGIMEMALDHFVKSSKFPPSIADICEELKGIHYEALQNVLILEPGKVREYNLLIMSKTEHFTTTTQRIKYNDKLLTGANQPSLEG